MVDVTAQLAQAAQRAQAAGLPYAGAVTPEEAHTLLNALHNAVLVDVRTQAEWNFVGGVPGAVCIEWKSFPGMQPNPDFLAQLHARVPSDAHVLFCAARARARTTPPSPPRQPATPTATTCWKALKAIATPMAIAAH